jgi:hypothetical protein
MKEIRSFVIDSSNMSKSATTRQFTIKGDAGAKFILYISNEDPKYYNFKTDTFGTTELKLIDELDDSGNYTRKIDFPAITDDDQYDFQLIANPHYDVKLSEDLSPSNSIYYRTKILQKNDVTLTFAVDTATTGDFQTMPSSITLTKPPSSTLTYNKKISWTVKAVDALSGGALKLTRQPVGTDFKFEITQTSNGTGSSGTVLYLDSVENLINGMAVSAIQSGSVSGSPVITNVSKLAKSVTLSVAQTWGDGKNITFKGDVSNGVNSLDTKLTFSDLSVELTPFTATVNQPTWDGTQTATNDIILDDAHGINAGGAVEVRSINMEATAGTQFVTGVTYGSNAITVTSNQQLEDNEIITFIGSSQEAVIRATVDVTKMPKSSMTFTLDLDSLLTSTLS